jgi:tetrahydromethanopterin S-methyltransferase subunit C
VVTTVVGPVVAEVVAPVVPEVVAPVVAEVVAPVVAEVVAPINNLQNVIIAMPIINFLFRNYTFCGQLFKLCDSNM